MARMTRIVLDLPASFPAAKLGALAASEGCRIYRSPRGTYQFRPTAQKKGKNND